MGSRDFIRIFMVVRVRRCRFETSAIDDLGVWRLWVLAEFRIVGGMAEARSVGGPPNNNGLWGSMKGHKRSVAKQSLQWMRHRPQTPKEQKPKHPYSQPTRRSTCSRRLSLQKTPKATTAQDSNSSRICTHACALTHTHARTRAHAHARARTHAHTHIRTHAHTHTHTCTRAHIHACTCFCTRVCTQIFR